MKVGVNFNLFTGTAGVSPASSIAFTHVAVEPIKSVHMAFNEAGGTPAVPVRNCLHLKLLLDPLAHHFRLPALVGVDFIV